MKTISIKPEPENGTNQLKPVEKEDTKTQEQPVDASSSLETKREERLSENGEETRTENVVEPILQTETDSAIAEQPGTDLATSPAGDPKAAATAILYEEGANSGANALDAGSVVWSVVQEAPAAGQPEEPAIRAQIEIPGRKTVLIMTIKRNADAALTASHLIELIFAVPVDFSGGAIDTINRFVLKQNEQGRGETLAAVPVKISDGIFLIALDNLAAAKQKNENLLQSRGWIDIPVQYRTGRRALVTIEKGAAGQKVFDEVFAAWAKAT